MQNKMNQDRLRGIVDRLGGYAATARALDVAPATVRAWVFRGRVSQSRAVKLARLAGVDVLTLRPDWKQ